MTTDDPEVCVYEIRVTVFSNMNSTVTVLYSTASWHTAYKCH